MPGDEPISKLPYAEVLTQLQILEHIEQKGTLGRGDAELKRQLEARENELVQAKISQSFAAPRSAEDILTVDIWKKACEDPAFQSKAVGLAHRHLQEEAQLAQKRIDDLHKFGPSEELDEIHAREQKLQSRHFDEERGRYARQFLRSLERAEQASGPQKQKGHEPGFSE